MKLTSKSQRIRDHSSAALLVAVSIALLAAAPLAVLEDSRILDPDGIREGLEAGDGTVRVIVSLVAPEFLTQFDRWNDLAGREELRAEVSLIQDEVFSRLDSGRVSVRHVFENQPGFSAEVTLAGLADLLACPEVETIETVQVVELATKQGIPQINATAVRNVYTGAGLSIAIVDTGIDYDHPDLGGGGFPNTKVIGGWDFGDDDANPMDLNGHGTSVAGIAGGGVNAQGDYIGGVAPDARLYALKVTGGSGGGTGSDAIIAAWDWCITHQHDDPDNPILVINNSMGGARHIDYCDEIDPAGAAAAQNCVLAGMTVLACTGNDGFCDATWWPACLSSVAGVGAVYDANIGGVGWCVRSESCAGIFAGQCGSQWKCEDSTTAQDQVTCYSNSNHTVTFLAPSNEATAPLRGGGYNPTFGGTSAACPYAAGAIAVYQQAAKETTGAYQTPGVAIFIIGFTGDSIEDPKTGLFTSRINLANAVEVLTPLNDYCMNASPIVDGIHPFTTVGATTDGPDEPGVCDFFGYTQIDSDVWFHYQAWTTAHVTVSLCGSGYDTKLAVYAGSSCPTGGTAIACNDDYCSLQSELTFQAIAGKEYLIRVGGYNAAQGEGMLQITSGDSVIAECQGIDNENVLIVNGITGVGEGHGVAVLEEGPIAAGMLLPSGGGNGKFVVHMNAGPPTGISVVLLPASLGPVCFPFLHEAGANPVAVFNNLGKTNVIGASNWFGEPIPDPPKAPTDIFYLPWGDWNLTLGSSWTLQGIILNPNGSSPKRASVTNAILMVVY